MVAQTHTSETGKTERGTKLLFEFCLVGVFFVRSPEYTAMSSMSFGGALQPFCAVFGRGPVSSHES